MPESDFGSAAVERKNKQPIIDVPTEESIARAAGGRPSRYIGGKRQPSQEAASANEPGAAPPGLLERIAVDGSFKGITTRYEAYNRNQEIPDGLIIRSSAGQPIYDVDGNTWTWARIRNLVDPETGKSVFDVGITFDEYNEGYGDVIIDRLMHEGMGFIVQNPDYLLDLMGDGSGSGRGRGASAQYIAPDRDAVFERVKEYVVATTGHFWESLTNEATDVMMNADARAFAGESIDPIITMKNYVRASSPYKSVHRQRPESVDELDWVTRPQELLRRAGVDSTLAESIGITQATQGATDQSVIEAGAIGSYATTGRLLEFKRESLKSKAKAALRLI